jgi:hypothetical protein
MVDERRGVFICQQCYATSFDTEPEAVKHEDTLDHSTVWSPANPTPRSGDE